MQKLNMILLTLATTSLLSACVTSEEGARERPPVGDNGGDGGGDNGGGDNGGGDNGGGDELVCNSAAPVCDGNGPRSGCDLGFICNTSCQCVAEPACNPDAPSCGEGSNSGCGEGFVCDQTCTCQAAQPPPEDLLLRPSRTTAVDITNDDTVVAMVNTDDSSVSFFNAQEDSESRLAKVASSAVPGAEPVAVIIHPDGKRAFVANRAAGSVARIVDIDNVRARLDGEQELGGEVMGLALTPSGRQLWAASWTQGTVSVISTDTMRVERTFDLGGTPFALAMTNDGDDQDDDEKVLITHFYAEARPGQSPETNDLGKQGRVSVIDVSGSAPRDIVLNPVESCFTGRLGDEVVTTGCFPNQVNAITVHRAFGRTLAFATSVAASPQGPVNFNHNVQALVSVIDVGEETEDEAFTHNLNELIARQQVDGDGDETQGRRFINVPNGIDFVGRDDIAIGYVSSAASDIVLRIEYAADGTAAVGAASAFNIPVGQNPQGIVIRHRPGAVAAYTGNLISRDLSVLSFRDQRTLRAVDSTSRPTDPNSREFQEWQGKRFFNTSTGIWSAEGWGSCQGCHPMGLTDNVTWSFATGPRQTIALDGQFASSDPTDMRALNWTAIFDETDDFELNTRGVSGGSGAIRNGAGPIASPEGPPFANILVEDGVTRENHQALNGSLSFVTENAGICTNANTCPDWGFIDAYIQTIRSPTGRSDGASVIAEGRRVFQDGGCDKCHAGPKWTVSKTFYEPRDFDGDLPNRRFATNRQATVPSDPTRLVGLPLDVNVDTTLVAGDDSEGGAPALKRQACNVRRVGTFGAPGGSDEVRANGQPAQGRNGFNPPSLLGAVLGAPFLHNGAASSLEDLLDPRFAAHS
ncbi:MAG: hypothetical protein AAFZ18_39275, partial [Myxococcota bacterium]